MTRFRRFGALRHSIIYSTPPEVNVETPEDIYALTSAYAKLGPRRDWLSRVTPLVLAAWNGHVDMVRFLLHEGANCNPDCELTPLTAAVERQHLEVVRLLLESGAQVNSRNSLGETALHVAATSASTDVWLRHMGGDSFGGKATAPQLSILRLLLENSADAQARSKETPPPICWATDKDVIRILCEHGAVPEKLKCPAPRDWARDGVLAALSRGWPACFFTFCAGFPHGLTPQTGHLLPSNLDEATGLPVHWVWGPQRSDQVQAVHGHNEGVWEWIKNHGLPWNSRKPWLKEITDPKRYVETESALQRTFLLTEESKVLISPDGKTEVRFTARPGQDAPIRSMLISSTKFFFVPGDDSPSLFDYQPDTFWPMPLNSKLPVLGQSWSETPQSWPCSPSGFGSAQQIELAWGPPGSELIFFRMLTREEEALGLQEKFVILDLPLVYWWKDVQLVTV